MFYKLYIEKGDFQDSETGEDRNLQAAVNACTPEGDNVGWTELEDEEAAMEYFGIKRKGI